MAAGINLFVASLDKRIDENYLRDEFGKFGDLLRVSIAKDEDGVSKNYGFIHFRSMDDGVRAMEEMNGRLLLGRTIAVALANNQEEGKFYKGGTRNSMWASEWDASSSTNNNEYEKLYGPTPPVSDYGSEYGEDQNKSTEWDVKNRMRKLFESQRFTDVRFYPKNNRNTSISAHRAILAIGSPLFTKMLFSDHSKDTAGMKMEVQISNMPFDAFTNIVKYLYTDEVFFENDTLVQGIMEGAKQFEITSLVGRCKQYFESIDLTNENVCFKLQMSISNKIDVLKERCIEFIERNTREVMNSPEFNNCSSTTVRTICKLQSLNIQSEFELLKAVMKWTYAQPPQNRKQLLDPLLKCIRFLTFSVTELGDALKQYPNLLPAEEGLSIMLYLYNPPKNPDFKKLPSWCNKSTMGRCFFMHNPNVPRNEPNPNRELLGKVLFPLTPDDEQSQVAELTSLLQMRCLRGRHTIKAIKLCFGKPLSDKSMINSLSINVHCHSSGFRTHENIQIVNSESVRVQFSRTILVRQGDMVDIEAEAKNIKSYKFLQFDESYQVLANPHFECCVSSRPKQGKLYFIREIEYGPQERIRRAPPRNNVRQREWIKIISPKSPKII